MRVFGVIRWSAHAAALLAVALLGFASTQSIVMQAAPATPGMGVVLCTSMGPAQLGAELHGHAGKHRASCPFCAAAAHPPLCTLEVAIPRPTVLTWASYAERPPLGPRGPPEVTPNARGPPTASLTI